jgi:hypothetical protein
VARPYNSLHAFQRSSSTEGTYPRFQRVEEKGVRSRRRLLGFEDYQISRCCALPRYGLQERKSRRNPSGNNFFMLG